MAQVQTRSDWPNSWWFIALVSLAAALPLLLPPVLPLIDLGGHVGRYAVQLDGGASENLRQWYTFTWRLQANLGVDLLVQLLGPMIGLEPAVKLIVAAIPALQVLGFLLIARAAHGRVTATAIFALPLALGLPLQFGFVNFLLGTALACLALALWMALGKAGETRTRWLVFIPVGFVLWLCHLVGWAVFGVLAGADVLLGERGRGCNWPRAVANSVLALLPLAVGPVIGLLASDHANGLYPISYQEFTRKVGWFLQSLRDRWPLWDRVSAGGLILVAVWFWRSDKFVLHKPLALGAALLLGLYTVMPDTIMGSQRADMRLAPLILALMLIAARPAPGCTPRFVARLTVLALAFTIARLAGNGVSLISQGDQFERNLAALEQLPARAELVTLYVVPCNEPPQWNADRRRHLSGYAIARRHAFDNAQWEMPGGQLLNVHNASAGRFQFDPSLLASDTRCPGLPTVEQAAAEIPKGMTHLWAIGVDPGMRLKGWTALKSGGDTVLYKRDP